MAGESTGVLCSKHHNTGRAKRGLRRCFLEAQAMGVPVVSFRHGGIPETMREGVTGLLAEERDVEGLAGQVLRYLGDDSFWSQSREEGMRWVRSNFDNSVQTAKLEEIYRRVISTFRSDNFEQSMQGA